MTLFSLLFVSPQGGFENGNFERLSTSGVDFTFVEFPIHKAIDVDEVLARFPCRPVKFVAFPFDQVE